MNITKYYCLPEDWDELKNMGINLKGEAGVFFWKNEKGKTRTANYMSIATKKEREVRFI